MKIAFVRREPDFRSGMYPRVASGKSGAVQKRREEANAFQTHCMPSATQAPEFSTDTRSG
ncbi:MAG: hypothetical protein DME31_04915 [Verrucomicrobia bacterium]|nr:MAG: hypothetical protein DME31_04915 [Verrucomicrobiota bacterium]PYL27637.1 MAG: hypothetical protein DMF39_10615 [Verrucomicrobiota bacterium]